MNFILPLVQEFNINKICCAGGFFLNVKLNQKIWESGLFDFQWVFPNQGDSGLALGACLLASKTNIKNFKPLTLRNYSYGPAFEKKEIKRILEERNLDYKEFDDVTKPTAHYLSNNLTVAWFQGRMETGPRSLGNRSILMSPIQARNKDIVNKKIKYREAFRPFCPSILSEFANEYLEDFREELFMTTSFKVNKNNSSKIPAVVHKDNTARPQFVDKGTNKIYYELIKEFYKISGIPVLLNTSLNVKGEPTICRPREAIKCFFDTGLDVLVLGNFILIKKNVIEY